MLLPYKIFSNGERLSFVSFIIQGPKKEASIDAFVDSGADFSIFDAAWLPVLGFQKNKGVLKKIQVGDGDFIKAHLFDVDVEFYGYRFRAPVTFSDQLGAGFNLLGRKGFFERMRFCFDDKHFVLSITRLR